MPCRPSLLPAATLRRLRPTVFISWFGLSLLLASPYLAVPDAWAQADSQRRHYAIEGGSLTEVLGRFGEMAGVMISVDPSLVRQARSDGLQGSYSVPEGLAALLAGSGLEAVPAGKGWRLRRKPGLSDASPVTLPAIAVTGRADKTEQAHHASGSVNVITRAQLDRVQATSARDIFAETPGVWVANGRQNPSLNVNIRGLQDATRINMMVDGARQGLQIVNGHSGVTQFVFIDPELLGDVTVSKGPTSGAHGAAQIGGVVNMRTIEADDLLQDGQTQGFRVRTTLGNSGYRASGSLAAAFRLTEQWDITAAVSGRRSHDYKAGTTDPGLYETNSSFTLDRTRVPPGAEVYGTAQDMHSGLLKTRVRFGDGHQLKLGASRYENTYGQQGSNRNVGYTDPERGGQDGGPQRGRIQSRGLDNKARAVTYTANYQWTPANNRWVDLRANLWRTSTNVKRPEYLTEFQTTSWGMEVYNTTLLPELPLVGAPRLYYGAEYFEDDGGSSSLKVDLSRNPTVAISSWAGELTGSGKRRVGSAFAELTLTPRDWLELTGGLRRDVYNMTGDGYYMSPVVGQGKVFFKMKNRESNVGRKLSLTLRPTDDLQLYAAYHEGFRPPAIAEALLSGAHGDMLQFNPNPDLKPEYAHNREVGLSLSLDDQWISGDKLRAKVVYFHNRVDGFIDFGDVTNYLGSYTTFINRERANFRGTEWLLTYDAGSAFMHASYTRFNVLSFCEAGVCTNEISSTLGSPFVPPKEKLALTAGVRLFERKLTLGARARRDGRRAAANDVNAGFGNIQVFWPAYTLYDVFGSLQLTPSVELGFSVENVRNTYYIDAMGSDLIPGPGRTFKAMLTMTF